MTLHELVDYIMNRIPSMPKERAKAFLFQMLKKVAEESHKQGVEATLNKIRNYKSDSLKD
jgi:hypothetical protein